jgi:hypothetical protein
LGWVWWGIWRSGGIRILFDIYKLLDRASLT